MATMYALPPIVPDTFSHMETASIGMYKLPPIQGSGQVADMGATNDQDPVAALEKRQESILDRLKALQIRVDNIQSASGGKVSSGSNLEVAIQASPLHPPYSLPLLAKLLNKKHGLKVFTTCHVHSSYTKPLPQKLTDFLEASTTERSEADIKIALIWKEVGPDPICTIGLLPNDCVRGEVNLLRFFGRMFGLCGYDALSGPKSHQEEETLDTIHSQLVWGDVTGDKKAVMNQAEAVIKAKGSSCASLSDLLAYSAAKAVFSAKMPPGVAKFVTNCEKSSRQGGGSGRRPRRKSHRKGSSSDDAKASSSRSKSRKNNRAGWAFRKRQKSTKSEDDFKYQWPSIQCVHTVDQEVWNSVGEVFVTEKLDGSCLAIGSKGSVASRRKILATQEDSLDKIKFSGSKLSLLKQHLNQDIVTLKAKIEESLKLSSTDQIIVYGEWINKGTATSTNDEYRYAERGIRPGTFHAFGVGVVVTSADDDSALVENTLGFRKGEGFWWAPLGPDLAKLLTSSGFTTVPVLGTWDLWDALPANLALLQPPCKAEGVIMSPQNGPGLPYALIPYTPHTPFILKWKNAAANTDVRHDEANLSRIQSVMNGRDDRKVDGVISSLRVTSTKTNDGFMEKVFASASSKHPSLEDVLHNSSREGAITTKEAAATQWFDAIEKEMLADNLNAGAVRSFLHKKKTVVLAQNLPKKK